jgi:hypothetical protein
MGQASSIADMFCRSRISAVGMLLAFTSLGGASSCLYHSSDRCDPGQIYDDAAGLCECDASQNLVTSEHGCVACGDHQVVMSDQCACEDGYQMVGTVCQLKPEALGVACTSDKDCTDAKYDTCHALAGGSGYCTNVGCKDDSVCDGGYACDMSASPAFCARPPTGDGDPCTTDAQCAGKEATFCEIYMSHVCYVEGCSLTANDCFPGKECCDLGPKSGGLVKKQICVKAGTCNP